MLGPNLDQIRNNQIKSMLRNIRSLMRIFTLMLLVITMSNCYGQKKDKLTDTAIVGCMYITDSATFTTTSGYLHRVASYSMEFKDPGNINENADSVVVRKVKTLKWVKYFIVSPIGNWREVHTLYDWDADLRPVKVKKNIK